MDRSQSQGNYTVALGLNVMRVVCRLRPGFLLRYLLGFLLCISTQAYSAGVDKQALATLRASEPGLDKLSGESPRSELDLLLNLLEQRLQLMKDVAAYKFAHTIAIENKTREQLVLESAMASARQHQLRPESIEAFFRLQIELAKVVQESWIDQWQAEGKRASPESDTADLSTTIRPKLIRLGAQLVEQIPRALLELHDYVSFASNLEKFESAITSPFISRAQKADLLHALIQVQALEKNSDSLSSIRHRGVLRVGTTGDYEPFSFMNPTTHNYTGIDIDLAADLAESLGVKLHLVKTSWPGLMTDLAAQKFDIGMSGISRTDARQRVAFFSEPYSRGGKTPIALCGRVEAFNTLRNIDQPGVRVIVNPGGTNEKFVRSRIRHAQIIVHPDNTTIFDKLMEQDADVMITDAIEVALQQRLHPQLCATMPGELLTHAEKAFLMPQNEALKAYVDTWLEKVNRSGALSKVFQAYLD